MTDLKPPIKFDLTDFKSTRASIRRLAIRINNQNPIWSVAAVAEEVIRVCQQWSVPYDAPFVHDCVNSVVNALERKAAKEKRRRSNRIR